MSEVVRDTVLKIFGGLFAILIVIYTFGLLSGVGFWSASTSQAIVSTEQGMNQTLHIFGVLIVGAISLMALGRYRR